MSNGKWQKEIPSVSGQYWIATRDGLSAGQATVYYHPHDGTLILAGKPGRVGLDQAWKGWWWSEPVREPKPPGLMEWVRSEALEHLGPELTLRIQHGDNTGLWPKRCAVCSYVDGHALGCSDEK